MKAALASALDDDEGMGEEDVKMHDAGAAAEAEGAGEGADASAVIERRDAGAVGPSGRKGSPADSLAGTAYEAVLLALLEGLR